MSTNPALDDAGSSHHYDQSDRTEPEAVARQVLLAVNETRAVDGLRYAVAFVLSLAAILVSGGLYLYMTKDQSNDFENQFTGYAARIVDHLEAMLERKMAALESMSASYTAHALSGGGPFPNVTLPYAEVRGAETRILADALFCQYFVLVTDENRVGWEAYAAAQQGWMDEAFAREVDHRERQDARFGFNRTMTTMGGSHRDLMTTMNVNQPRDLQVGFNPKIYDLSRQARPDGSGPYMVYWQNSPVMPLKAVLNFDMMSHPHIRTVLLKMMETERAVMDVSSNLLLKVEGEEAASSNEIIEVFMANGQFRHHIETYEGSPLTDLVYPVFDGFGADRKLAGAINTALFWREHFVNVLPENAEAVVAVISNTCNQTFSFQVDGQGVVYLGLGDAHDPKYTHLVVQQAVASSLNAHAAPNNRAYAAVDLDESLCRYSIAVYPSQALEDSFLTNQPIIFTAVVASIFLFTSLVFVLYDLLVARRQRIVMAKALQSGAIINSLFPENVQARLFGATAAEQASPTGYASPKGQRPVAPTLRSLDGIVDEKPAEQKDAAIADLFPNCTVLFADIAGFTGWSSGRAPKDVFELLETFFGAFDAIAHKRKVFKVETIGDCYLAVTGLPEAQEDHAIIVCRFANEMVLKMSQVRNDLVDRLGPETAELQLRVGLHSGPVTAGVLRGQKSRFQLFGDTVNTASRMESTSEKGQIQVSQTTADEVVARGKEYWLLPRKDKVVAKGKGEMQTYWSQLRPSKSSVTTSSD